MHTRENNEEHSQGVTLMTGGSVRRQIVRFALPVFWGNLFQQLYNIVDSLVVGNFLGSDALAAVGSSGNIIFLLVGLFGGLFTGNVNVIGLIAAIACLALIVYMLFKPYKEATKLSTKV